MPDPDHMKELVLGNIYFFVQPAWFAAVQQTILAAACRADIPAGETTDTLIGLCLPVKVFFIRRFLLQLTHIGKPVLFWWLLNWRTKQFIIKDRVRMLTFLALLGFRHLAGIFVISPHSCFRVF